MIRNGRANTVLARQVVADPVARILGEPVFSSARIDVAADRVAHPERPGLGVGRSAADIEDNVVRFLKEYLAGKSDASPPGNLDRSTLAKLIVGIAVHKDRLVVRLKLDDKDEASDQPDNQSLTIPWQKPPSKTSRRILLPHNTTLLHGAAYFAAMIALTFFDEKNSAGESVPAFIWAKPSIAV